MATITTPFLRPGCTNRGPNRPISVAATWEDGALVLRPNNAFVAVTRHLEADVLVWKLLPLRRVTWMRRV